MLQKVLDFMSDNPGLTVILVIALIVIIGILR